MDDCRHMRRREFLQGAKRWSGAVATLALTGEILAVGAPSAAAWVNGSWSNGGAWNNRYGGSGWANRGGAWANGGTAWANRSGWANGSGGWANRGGSWVNTGSGGWINRYGGGGVGWINR